MRLPRTLAVIVLFGASRLAIAAAIHGHVFIGNQSCPASHLTIRFNPPATSPQSVLVTTTEDDGTFQLQGADGQYYVGVYQGDRQVYGHLLSVSNHAEIEIELEANGASPVPCGRDVSAPLSTLASQPSNTYTFTSRDSRDWRPADTSYDVSTGLVVLDLYGRATRIYQSSSELGGELLFRLPLPFAPVAIGAGRGAVFVSANGPLGCTVFQYSLLEKRLTNRLIDSQGKRCGGLAVAGAEVYLAIPELQEVKYWSDWQSAAARTIPFAFSVSGAAISVDVPQHRAVLADADGSIYVINSEEGKATKLATFHGNANAVGLSSHYVLIASGKKIIAYARDGFKSSPTPRSLSNMLPGTFVGIAIDTNDKAWVIDSDHDLIRGPLDLD
jgi:hypothetical protein